MLWLYEMLPLGLCLAGGTGTGKTRRLLLPFLDQLLALRLSLPDNEKWAALVLDPKLSFANFFVEIARQRGQSDRVILLDGVNFVHINPLKSGLPPEKIAEMLHASLLAGASVTRSSGAAYYEKRAIALLAVLIRLAMLAIDPSLKLVSQMADALSQGKPLSCHNPAGEESLQRLENFLQDDERERKMVLSSVHNILEPFRSEPWHDIFFVGGDFHLKAARDDGWILVCAFAPGETSHLNTGLYLLKQLWFSTIMMRMNRNIPCNRERYCFYIADEFQQVCGRGSEADFFAVRREALGCPIVAFQQVSQIRSALGDEWETVLGLLSHKIFLRNSDPDCNFYAQKLGGEVEVISESFTQITEQYSTQYQDKSRTLAPQIRPRVPADYFFTLPDGDAVFYGNERKLFWFPAYGLSFAEEKRLRKTQWPQRPRLLSPREYRA